MDQLLLLDSFQLILLLLNLALLVIVILQIISEQFQKTKITTANIKYKIHRTALIFAILTAVYSLDPFAHHGLFNHLALYMMFTNATCLLLASGLVIVHASVTVYYRSNFKATPFWFHFAVAFGVVSSFLVANIVPPVAQAKNLQLTGIILLWDGLVVAVFACIFGYSQYYLISHLMSQHNSSSASRPSYSENRTRGSSDSRLSNADVYHNAQKKKLDSLRFRLYSISIGCAIAAPAQIIFGITRLSSAPTSTDLPVADLDNFSFTDCFFPFLQSIVFAIILWYAWTPIAFKKPKKEFKTEYGHKSLSHNRSSSRSYSSGIRQPSLEGSDLVITSQ